MSERIVKTRFAPSPTGRLHLGNLRTALFSALHAWSKGGIFVLRIEDTDAARSQTEHIEALKRDLHWLGLDWQEGPDAGGEAGPYLQSQRADIYAGLYARLLETGWAYPCFCSEAELEASRAAQRAAGLPPRYAGTCAHLPAGEAEARVRAGEPHTLRFRVPRGQMIQFEDLVRGPQTVHSDTLGDFVIRRTDGTPAFFFCNAVDDALMGVTHVWRGEDHLSNTSRQLLILQALDLPAPRYGHLALIVGDDGAPLSKRHGATSLEALRKQGYLPAAITNYLARLGHAYTDEGLLDLNALAAGFDPVRLSRAAARFDPAQLDHWQRLAVGGASLEALQRWGKDALAPVPPALRPKLLAAVRDNLLFPEDLHQWVQALYGEPLPDAAARAAMQAAPAALFDTALELLPAHEGDFGGWIQALRARTGLQGRALFMPLRAALTGRTHGPELARLFDLLGKEALARRLAAATTRN